MNFKYVLAGAMFGVVGLISCSVVSDMGMGSDVKADTHLETECASWRIYRADTLTIPLDEGLDVKGFPFESNDNFVFTRSCIEDS